MKNKKFVNVSQWIFRKIDEEISEVYLKEPNRKFLQETSIKKQFTTTVFLKEFPEFQTMGLLTEVADIIDNDLFKQFKWF